MSTLMRRTAGTAIGALLLVACTLVARAGDWTEGVEVRLGLEKCVSYRARLEGEFLVVQARHEKGWHTFAMDNELRAKEKLAGRQSLGVDGPTNIEVTQGLKVVGGWYQSRPKDFSKPELRWFSWGFEEPALFVAKVLNTEEGPAGISIRGQACSDTKCKDIDVAIPLPLGASGEDSDPVDIDFKSLVEVRQAQSTEDPKRKPRAVSHSN